MATTNPISDSAPPAENQVADLLVVLAASTPPEQLEGALANLAQAFTPESVIVAAPDGLGVQLSTPLRIVPAARSTTGWALKPVDFINAFEIGQKHQARAVLILGPGSSSMSPTVLRSMADSVLSTSTDLVLPHYSLPPNTGLINSAILYPLTRALFAASPRFPLAIDLGLSMRMVERLAFAAQRLNAPGKDDALLWPVNEAIAAGFLVEEIQAGPRAMPQPANVDISAVLALVTGSLFGDIEAKAAVWQRPRRSSNVQWPTSVNSPAGSSEDVAHMVEAFRLAYTNLSEIWSLVLPPHSMLALKRFSVVDAAVFRMPENLWARIVFDFLVAYRLRTINRGHLMGALIPLYLAWVAGHINVTASGTAPDLHIQEVAASFETDKPYLVARWRWPDRFNA